jgi:hypothetical protein
VRRLVPAALLALLLAAAAARATPPAPAALDLSVTGSVVATTPRLQVRVVVTNRSEHAVPSLDVVGELLGQRQESRIATLVGAGGSATTSLDFDATSARPGEHALVLLLEHPIEGAPDAAGNPPLTSERAWLPVTLGQKTTPAVRLEPRPSPLEVFGRLDVTVTSADRAAHRVRLRAFVPRGLRSDGDGVELEVPAAGAVVAGLPLVRAGAPRGTAHSVLLVAETVDEPLLRTSVARATVQVAPFPSRLPRLRVPILVLACLLLGAAVGVEIWLRARREPAGPPGPPASPGG